MGIIKYVEDIVISSKSTANGIPAASVLGASVGSALNGEVYLVDASQTTTEGQVLNAASFATTPAFTIVPIVANGQTKTVQPKIRKADIVAVTKEVYSAPTTKQITLGFNGTTGDLTVSKNAEGTYEYAIISKIITDTTFQDLFKNYITSYPTTAFAATTPTNQEKLDYFYQFIAEWNGTADNINTRSFRNQSEHMYKYTDLSLIYSTSALTAVGTSTTATYGSYTVNSTAHGVTEGSYVRLGATSTTGVTNGIYKVASVVNANTFTITTPYKGVTGTSATYAALVTTGATPTFGFVITVKPNATPYTVEGGVQTFVFDANFSRQDDNTNSIVVDAPALKTVVEPKWSSGHNDSVKDAEFKHLTLDGVITRYGWGKDAFVPATRTVAGTNYDLFTISYRDTNVLSDQNIVRNSKMVSIYVPQGSAFSTELTGMLSTLSPYILM